MRSVKWQFRSSERGYVRGFSGDGLSSNDKELARTRDVGTTESVRDLSGDDLSSKDKVLPTRKIKLLSRKTSNYGARNFLCMFRIRSLHSYSSIIIYF